MSNYKDFKTIERNFEQQLPDVQITDIQEVNARQYVVWTSLDTWSPLYEEYIGRGSYGVYIADGYIEDYRTSNKMPLFSKIVAK